MIIQSIDSHQPINSLVSAEITAEKAILPLKIKGEIDFKELAAKLKNKILRRPVKIETQKDTIMTVKVMIDLSKWQIFLSHCTLHAHSLKSTHFDQEQAPLEEHPP